METAAAGVGGSCERKRKRKKARIKWAWKRAVPPTKSILEKERINTKALKN